MLTVKNMKYEQRNDPVVDNNVYDAKIVSFKEFTFKDRQGQDVQKIIVIAEITEDGFKGIQVPGYVFANFRPSTRSTVNLRRWCEALGAQFPAQEQEEWSFDLDTLIGTPCKIKTEQYMGFDKRNNVQVTKCKIMDIMPIHKRAPMSAIPAQVPTMQTQFASAVAQTAQAQDIAMQRAYTQTVGVVSSPTMTVPTPVQPVIPAQQVVPQVANQPVFPQVATQAPVQQAVPQPVQQPVMQPVPQVVPQQVAQTVTTQQPVQQPTQQYTPSTNGSEEVSPW